MTNFEAHQIIDDFYGKESEKERTDSVPMDKKVEDLLVAFKKYMDRESRNNNMERIFTYVILIMICFIMDAADIMSLIV